MFKICNDLIAAYTGTYENELVQQGDGSFKRTNDMTTEEFQRWVEWKIVADSPKERLETYLTWEGIHGYSSRIYDIAMGKMPV